MKKALFLYNISGTLEKLGELKIPYQFVSYGYIEGALYYCKKDYIALDVNSDLKKHKGFNKVYGILIVIDKSEFYMRAMDAINCCSKTSLNKNHDLDIMHRVKRKFTPISFKSIDDFFKMKYREYEEIEVETYIGNTKNKNIKQMVKRRESRYNIGLIPQMLKTYAKKGVKI